MNYTRNCPICDATIQYKSDETLAKAQKKQSVCKRCARLGNLGKYTRKKKLGQIARERFPYPPNPTREQIREVLEKRLEVMNPRKN